MKLIIAVFGKPGSPFIKDEVIECVNLYGV